MWPSKNVWNVPKCYLNYLTCALFSAGGGNAVWGRVEVVPAEAGAEAIEAGVTFGEAGAAAGSLGAITAEGTKSKRNGILLPTLFWPTVRKNCSSDWEKILKFEAEGRKFANILRSLEQFIQAVNGQNKFW